MAGHGRKTGCERRALLFLLTVCLATVGVMGAEATKPSIGAQASVQTVFHFPTDPLASDFESVWLAGFGVSKEAPPSVLGLKWVQDTSSWIPIWTLQLHGAVGLLPPTEVPPLDSATGMEFVTLATLSPKWGVEYETFLSVDLTRGYLSIWVGEVAGEVVYSRVLNVSPYAEALVPAAGHVQRGPGDPSTRFVPLQEVATYPWFVPRAAEWSLVARVDGALDPLPTTLIDRSRGGDLVLVLRPNGAQSGEFAFYADQAGERTQLVSVLTQGEEQRVPLPLDSLPFGRFNLTMEYVAEGTVWFTSTREITLGKVDARVSAVTFDRDANVLRGTVALRADGPLPGTRVQVNAELSELIWDESTRRYHQARRASFAVVEQDVTLSQEALELQFAITAPDAVGLWQLRFDVQTDPRVTVAIQGSERLVGTYARPELSADKPFTIAILPDTQKYSFVSPLGGYPDIFVRQLAWLAEHAAKENIALTLHVGDITDHNAPHEWEVAQKSISLLDGVMPYVLTNGNHDMGAAGNGADRTTLFNDYFPVARYEGLPSFGGVFEPGRLENSYHTFDFSGQKILVVALEFLPRDIVLEWANRIVTAHPDHWVIVLTHRHTGADGLLTTSPGSWNYGIGHTNTGLDVWTKFIRHHANIQLVVSGHIYHDAMPRGVRLGINGNHVFEMLSDFSGGPYGGTGWLVLLRFFPDHDRIGVSVYSPFLMETKYDRTDRFDVPFCIDRSMGRYVAVDDTCFIHLD